MRIRRYREDDFHAVARLWDSVGFNVPPNDPARDIPFLTKHANAALFVDEDDGAIIGSVMGGHDGHRGWIYRLAVNPGRRGEGRGRALMSEIETWLAARGLIKVELMIRGSDRAVEKFYEHIGYELSDRTVMARLFGEEERRSAIPRIPVVITYLEMTERPAHETARHPSGKIAILRAEKLPVHMFRYFYRAIGARWFWWERCRITDDAVAAIIHDPQVEVYLLNVEGCPAGYVEIDRRKNATANLNYMGLIPEYIGSGYGRYLLQQSLELAWAKNPGRVTVDTCTLDHPGALRSYQRAGFTPYSQIRIEIDDPRVSGDIPEQYEPNLPT
jgi:GNAT superfamily N-acetyltransferase